MSQQDPIDRVKESVESSTLFRRHPLTEENSPEETIRRMRSLPERAAKLRESLRVLREARLALRFSYPSE